MTFFSTSEKLEIGGIPFISTHPKPHRDEALEYYRRVVPSQELRIHLYEKVTSLQKNSSDVFDICTEKGSYTAPHSIIATGFYDLPKFLNVPGETLPKVDHYFKEAHPYALQKTIIEGASNSAVNATLEIYRKGGEVTLVVRGPAIEDRAKYWVKPDIENRISEGSIRAYFNSEIKEIKEKEVLINTPQGVQKVSNDFVLALTGYQPNLSFLKVLGITFSEDVHQLPTYHLDTMETNVPGIYLAGVICGGMETHKWFIENSRSHADLIVNDIVLKRQ